MQKKKIKLKHRVEYILFIVFVWLIKGSPLFVVRFNRRLLQYLFARIGKKNPGVVVKNLKTAFPGYSGEEISALTKAISRHFSYVFTEIITIFVKRRPDRILKEIEIHHLDFLERALEKKKGVILFSAHFGNWELIPYILSRKLNRKINSVAREMNNPLVERKVKQFREYMGSEVIYKQNSIRTILNRLKKNGIVYLLIDHNTIAREGVGVNFFGKMASAVPSVSQLHIKRAIPIIPIFLHYEKDKIVLDLLEEIDVTGTGTGNQKEDIRQLTQRCTSIIEEKIRQYPEQWFWFHNRWKTRPGPAQTREQ
ncbi:MAG: lysophospholipid acyltransferase family protein [Candidatus Aminicenantes bacterium]|nr:MAG: lysophospholipid acyltransferase family protein [Candidatus Aminicenantes bacterium]